MVKVVLISRFIGLNESPCEILRKLGDSRALINYWGFLMLAEDEKSDVGLAVVHAFALFGEAFVRFFKFLAACDEGLLQLSWQAERVEVGNRSPVFELHVVVELEELAVELSTFGERFADVAYKILLTDGLCNDILNVLVGDRVVEKLCLLQGRHLRRRYMCPLG